MSDLLTTGHYGEVAKLLGQAAFESELTGDASLAQTLAAAYQICLALRQCELEVEWHQQACQEANQRERELRQQLHPILDLVCRHKPVERQEEEIQASSLPEFGAGMPEPDVPVASEGPGLWQRVKSRLGWRRALAAERAKRAGAVPARVEQEREPPSLAVYCLGPFRVYQDEELISDWPSGKGKCIFKYMLAHLDRPISKEIFMDLFWRDADPEAARNNLNTAIYGLRQAFRAGRPDFSHILFEDDHYLLNPAVSVWVDVEEFIQHYEAGRTLEKGGKWAEAVREYEVAEGLYLGDFLEEDLYEDWPIPRRQALKDSYLIILDRLSRYYLEEKTHTTCIYLCQKMLAEDDCREDAHRRLMRCYSRQGQRNLALRQYHVCEEILARALDVSPMQETTTLYHQIRRGEAI